MELEVTAEGHHETAQQPGPTEDRDSINSNIAIIGSFSIND